MKILDNIIKSNIIQLVFVTIVLIFLTVLATVKFYGNYINNNYEVDNFIINSDKRIKTKLKKLNDSEGLKEKGYKVNITNNGEQRYYKILLSPLVDNESEIRVAFNNNVIRNLSSFEKYNDSYVIYNYYLPKSYSSINTIKIWQKQDSTLDNINVNFDIKFEIGK